MKNQDFSSGKRGAIDPIPDHKTQITLTLDKDVIEWFREQTDAAGGGNYQTHINDVLRQYVEQARAQQDP